MLNIKTFSYENDEHLFGPGKRLLIFCQGCTLRCPGCINQHLWEFGTGQDITPEEVLKLCNEVEGVTLHGGEPLDQSKPLLDVVKILKNNNTLFNSRYVVIIYLFFCLNGRINIDFK